MGEGCGWGELDIEGLGPGGARRLPNLFRPNDTGACGGEAPSYRDKLPEEQRRRVVSRIMIDEVDRCDWWLSKEPSVYLQPLGT
jgi:hypothetical protein